jgi:phage-related tail protein
VRGYVKAVPALAAYAKQAITAALANETLNKSGKGIISYLSTFRNPVTSIKSLGNAVFLFAQSSAKSVIHSLTVVQRFALVASASAGGGITGIFAGIKAAFLALTAPILSALAPIGAAIAAIGWPVLAVIAAIAGAALLIYEFWEPISSFFSQIAETIMGFFEPVIEDLKELWGEFVEVFELIKPVLIAVGAIIALPFIAIGAAIVGVI